MCDFSGRLVAWIDRELCDNDAADVERHLRDCSECRRRVDAYKQVSRALVAHYDAVMEGKRRRRQRWIPVLASATGAAAVLLLVFQPASVKQIPVRPSVADSTPAIILETAPKPVKTIHRRRVIAQIGRAH